MKRKRNYSRLYAIAKAKGIDLDEHKEVLVSQFTGGRTTSLRDMTPAEYEEMCECLQTGKQVGESTEEHKERLRRARSAGLDRLQRLGVDTADRTFAAVNRFCMNTRIIGKPFGMLSVEELQALIPKLEAILRKPRTVKPQRIVHIPLFIRPDQLPS
jgi:hypothetical protein